MIVQIENYTFDASAGTVTFTDFATIKLESILSIVNVIDNRAIYNPLNKELEGTVSGNVLTLVYDTSRMSDDHKLQIYYDDTDQPATEAKQDVFEELLREGVDRYLIQIQRGEIAGVDDTAFAGHVETTTLTEETIHEQGGLKTYLSDNTQLYASSTEGADNQTFFIGGIDEDFNVVSRLVTLNGQNQVALDGLIYIITQATNVSPTPHAGDVYIAQADSLTGGKPNTDSKIQSKILARQGQSHDAVFTVPVGKQAILSDLEGSIGKGKDTSVYIKFKAETTAFIYAPPFELYQNPYGFGKKGFLVNEKTIIEISLISRSTGTPITASFNKVLLFDT